MDIKPFTIFSPPEAVYHAVLPGATLLNLNVSNVAQLEWELFRGLRVAGVRAMGRRIGIDAKTLGRLLGARHQTLQMRHRSRRLTTQQSAVAYRLARGFEHAVMLIGSETDAREWLREKMPSLGQRTPLEALATVLGYERVLNLLERCEDGVYS
jgi:putative toxin-antitoxin system antitoxin component (TIGR02293 family)